MNNSSVHAENKPVSMTGGAKKGMKKGDKKKMPKGKKGGASCALSPMPLAGGKAKKGGKMLKKRGGALKDLNIVSENGKLVLKDDDAGKQVNAEPGDYGLCELDLTGVPVTGVTAENVTKLNNLLDVYKNATDAAKSAALTALLDAVNALKPPASGQQAAAAAPAPAGNNGNGAPEGEGDEEAGAKAGEGMGGARKGKKGKKGGALVDDIKSLAVPFAILLAKQGLEGMFSNKKSTSAKKSSESAALKNRKKTMVGGACGCAAAQDQKGGKAKKGGSKTAKSAKSDTLAKSIDNFLRKY